MTNNDMNLNDMLNTDEIATESSETTDTAELITSNEENSSNAEQEAVSNIETQEVSSWVNLFDYVRRFSGNIVNASLTNISGFSRVPEGKYLLFCTADEDNADLILFDRPNTLWVEESSIPETIKVFNSGLVIMGSGFRYYVGKNNVIKIDEVDGINSDVKLISRSKTNDAVKVSSVAGERSSADIDTIKLHAKRVSPRLYNAIHELNDRSEIKTAIIEFMTRINDLNHLIKIEKEILYALTI